MKANRLLRVHPQLHHIYRANFYIKVKVNADECATLATWCFIRGGRDMGYSPPSSSYWELKTHYPIWRLGRDIMQIRNEGLILSSPYTRFIINESALVALSAIEARIIEKYTGLYDV